jgi:hypothetical protein
MSDHIELVPHRPFGPGRWRDSPGAGPGVCSSREQWPQGLICINEFAPAFRCPWQVGRRHQEAITGGPVGPLPIALPSTGAVADPTPSGAEARRFLHRPRADRYPPSRIRNPEQWRLSLNHPPQTDRTTSRGHMPLRRGKRAFDDWKRAMWDMGCKLPTQVADGQSTCFCGAAIGIADMASHVYAAHMDTA